MLLAILLGMVTLAMLLITSTLLATLLSSTQEVTSSTLLAMMKLAMPLITPTLRVYCRPHLIRAQARQRLPMPMAMLPGMSFRS
jgi:hypothetical protein